VLFTYLDEVAGALSEAFGGTPARPNRLAQDVAVDGRTATGALSLRRAIGDSPTQNAYVQARIEELVLQGAQDIRVNQTQVNVLSQRVGINRPDLQYTLNDVRYYEEFEVPSSARGPGHVDRLEANDPYGFAEWYEVP
jgi:hypothetical protein